MKTFLLLAVFLNINLVVHSTPQFFGQSFSSSSVVNPNGQVVSQSVYVDSEGNRVVNGQKVPSQAPFLSPLNPLVPPPPPGFIYNQQQFNPQPATSAPARKPAAATQAPAKKPTTSPTKKPVTSPTKKPVTSSPAKKPITTAATKKPITTKPNRPATQRPATSRPGQKAPLNINGWPTDGSYIHDNSGAWVPDRRGLYRGQ